MISLAVVKVGNLLVPHGLDGLRGELHINRELSTSTALPSGLTSPSGARLEETACRLAGHLVGRHDQHDWDDVVGLEGADHLLGHDRGGHGGTGIGRDVVDEDVVLLALTGESTTESKDATLGCGVVGLAKVTVDTGGGGGVDDTTVFLLEEVGPCGFGGLVSAAEMDVHDLLEHLVFHIVEGLVAEDSGVVDQAERSESLVNYVKNVFPSHSHINTAKVVNRSRNNLFAVLGTALDTNSLAAHLLDLLDHGLWVSQIVHNDSSAILGQGQAVGTS